jgi:hypothetical protein
MSLSDTQFLRQFEDLSLPPEEFGHRGHLRLAWLYLSKYPLEEAITRIATGISRYANGLGATGKFHHTLTEAIVRIMASRLEGTSYNNLDDYLSCNPDLVNDVAKVVRHYYSDQCLNSAEARQGFIAPDLRGF